MQISGPKAFENARKAARFDSLLEHKVHSLLEASPLIVSIEYLRTDFDFLAITKDNEKIIIEVKGGDVRNEHLERLGRACFSLSPAPDRFILVTPAGPNDAQSKRFEGIFCGSPIVCEWMDLNSFAVKVGLSPPSDLKDPHGLGWVHLAAIASSTTPPNRKSNEREGPKLADSNPAIALLRRQFPPRVIDEISRGQTRIEEHLKIAQRVGGVTVVTTDIANFSSMVSASGPEDLCEAMTRYYRLAREAVFDHGGMLDKFIGDAVLSVFGYPISKAEDACSALKFGAEIIGIGRDVLYSWQENLNHAIETGTRVGVATGDIWPVNMGQTQLEIALLGDTISLATRLEANCHTDALLIDQRTYNSAKKKNSNLVDMLGLEQTEISPLNAKGQTRPIKAWRSTNRLGEKSRR